MGRTEICFELDHLCSRQTVWKYHFNLHLMSCTNKLIELVWVFHNTLMQNMDFSAMESQSQTLETKRKNFMVH